MNIKLILCELRKKASLTYSVLYGNRGCLIPVLLGKENEATGSRFARTVNELTWNRVVRQTDAMKCNELHFCTDYRYVLWFSPFSILVNTFPSRRFWIRVCNLCGYVSAFSQRGSNTEACMWVWGGLFFWAGHHYMHGDVEQYMPSCHWPKPYAPPPIGLSHIPLKSIWLACFCNVQVRDWSTEFSTPLIASWSKTPYPIVAKYNFSYWLVLYPLLFDFFCLKFFWIFI